MKKRFLLTAILLFGLSWSLLYADSIPRPEHPRPDFYRASWITLNGQWQFEIDENGDGKERGLISGKDLKQTIMVPFCPESKLSGIAHTDFMKNVWYRRLFDLPETFTGKRILLHFGAVDYLSTIWINGVQVGQHRGGTCAFDFDITEYVRPAGNELVLHVFDDTRSGLQPCGKQSQQPESNGCVYTRTTGIWQSVYLEGVGSSYISDFCLTVDPDHSRVLIQVEVDGPSNGLAITARARAEGKEVGNGQMPAAWRNGQLVLDLSQKRLWSPEDPFLYDLELTLTRGSEVVDQVAGYFGLRKVTIEGAAILINDKPVFQRTVLDQGFYPEGIWTAPSDADLKRDIELSQEVGFNGARLHQKVFEPRFFYWADKLGYLVWGEFPNWGLDYGNPKINAPLMDEWQEIIRRDRNHPCIIGWCPFNETSPAAGELQRTTVLLTRMMDPTRPVLETSGWTHTLADPEVMDMHDYDQNPETFRSRYEEVFRQQSLPARYGFVQNKNIPFFISEYGGIGWFKEGDPAWGYGNSPKTLEEFYQRYEGLTNALLDNRYMFGFCYTQLTDIEQERNGIYYYDRTPKFDAAKLHAINSRTAQYEIDPPLKGEQKKVTNWKVLVGANPDKEFSQPWRYTTDKPGENWYRDDFDDAAWKVGKSAFGQKGGSDQYIQTPWNTADIYLRQTFTCDTVDFDAAALIIHYDDNTEVYVNGTKIWSHKDWNDRYEYFDVTGPLRDSMQAGENTIAVYCHQNWGGQFIDLAILVD